MARPTDNEIFLTALKAQGNRAGNTALLRDLKWIETKYWTVHRRLHEAGLIEKGRGYGGTVILAQHTIANTAALKQPDGNRVAPATSIEPAPAAIVEALVEE